MPSAPMASSSLDTADSSAVRKAEARNWLNVEGLTKELAERSGAHKLGHALALLDVGLRGRPQRRRRALLHAETTLTTRLHPDVLRVT